MKLLVLDEPTSTLTKEDASRLFALVKRLKEQGVTVVYISHFLEEIEAVADRFTVLRDGQAVGSGRVGDVTRERIVEMMVGRTVTEQYPRIPHTIGEPVLELTDLCGEELPEGVNPRTAPRRDSWSRRDRRFWPSPEMLRAVYGPRLRCVADR